MAWPKGRARPQSERDRIAASMRLTGGRRRAIIVVGDGTARVPLTSGAEAIIDAVDIPLVADRSWYLHSAGYAITRRDGVPYYMHRVILHPPSGLEVDHVNGNRLDNRRANLRPATPTDQRANAVAKSGTVSRYRGVTVGRGKAHPWVARIRGRSLGAFVTEEEAARAADAEMRRIFGSYARLNFPESEEAA